jgi:hypothetical protein
MVWRSTCRLILWKQFAPAPPFRNVSSSQSIRRLSRNQCRKWSCISVCNSTSEHLFSTQASLLLLRHGSCSRVFPADIAMSGGVCANHDGSVIMTLHRGGSIVAWSECSRALVSDDTSRFRPLCSNDCPAATTFAFISPKVMALACADTSIALWHVIDGKRGLSWKAHSSGVSIFLMTQGAPDGLSWPGLFSFSRSGVGQVCLSPSQL